MPENPGDVCTIPGSPLTLINTSSDSFAVTGRVLGFVTNAMGEVSDFTGDFTSQITTMSLEDALASLDDENDFVQSSWSGEFAFTPRSTRRSGTGKHGPDGSGVVGCGACAAPPSQLADDCKEIGAGWRGRSTQTSLAHILPLFRFRAPYAQERGHPARGRPGVTRRALPKYTFRSTASGSCRPYSFQKAW